MLHPNDKFMKKFLLAIGTVVVLILVGSLAYIRFADKKDVSTLPEAQDVQHAEDNSELPVASSSGEFGDDVNGRHLGKIISITDQSQPSLSIDYVQWTSCSDDDCPNGYRIKNDNPKIRTFPIVSNPDVKLQTFGWDSTGNFDYDQHISFAGFVEIFANPRQFNNATGIPSYDPKKLYYWITLKDGAVIEIEEQYQP